MESLVNEDTNLIHDNIPTVLTFLFKNYGVVQSEEVKQQKTDIQTMTFQPSDPMVLIYNPIKKLRKLATAASIEYTEAQIIDIGLTVIRNTRDFKTALGEWDAKPINN